LQGLIFCTIFHTIKIISLTITLLPLICSDVSYKDHVDRDVRGVSKKFGDWYQKTNKAEDTNKLTLLAFKIITILNNTLLATFIKLLETADVAAVQERVTSGSAIDS
jgi:hypothetical protein